MIVGIKSGCYTLFHAGHFWMLEQCAKKCDYLIALTNDDEYVREKKGCLPLPAEDKRLILSHHDYVKEAHTFHGQTEDDWIADFKDNMLFRKFGKWAQLRVFHSEELEGQDWVPGQDYADSIVFVPKQSSPYNTSVTQMIAEIKQGIENG